MEVSGLSLATSPYVLFSLDFVCVTRGCVRLTNITRKWLDPSSEEGFPGAVEVSLTYRLVGGRELHLLYDATTSAPTPISLTNDAYFNLRGVSRLETRAWTWHSVH